MVQEIQTMLCDKLESWDGVGGGKWEGVSRGRGHIYTYAN